MPIFSSVLVKWSKMHNLHTQITTIYLALSIFVLLALIPTSEKTYIRILNFVVLPSFFVYILLMAYVNK